MESSSTDVREWDSVLFVNLQCTEIGLLNALSYIIPELCGLWSYIIAHPRDLSADILGTAMIISIIQGD